MAERVEFNDCVALTVRDYERAGWLTEISLAPRTTTLTVDELCEREQRLAGRRRVVVDGAELY